MVRLDDRLRRTLDEVSRLEGGGRTTDVAPVERAPAQPAEDSVVDGVPARASGRTSQLTPKEIQAQLRAGRSVQEVSRMAGTEPGWIERFLGPIIAERKGIVEAVKAGVISRPRRGRSATTVGDAILANLRERRIHLSAEALEDGWRAVRGAAGWEVSFRYLVRGQLKEAQFAFDVDSRTVVATNPMATQIGWRPTTAVADVEDEPEEAAPAPPPPVTRPAASFTAKATPTVRQVPAAPGKASSTRPTPAAQAAGARNQAASARPGGRVGVPAPDPVPRRGRPGRPVAEEPEPPVPAPRGRRQAVSPQGAGAADERPSFARRTSSPPRPRRLASEDEDAWKAAMSRRIATRKGRAETPTPPPPPRSPRKRLPDDWLLEP